MRNETGIVFYARSSCIKKMRLTENVANRVHSIDQRVHNYTCKQRRRHIKRGLKMTRKSEIDMLSFCVWIKSESPYANAYTSKTTPFKRMENANAYTPLIENHTLHANGEHCLFINH